MEGLFPTYFKLGIAHILDPNGLDHILYILTLAAGLTWRHWRQGLALVTAFTVGHSITLIAVGMDLFRVPSLWVETAIPITILISALIRLRKPVTPRDRQVALLLLTLGFGFIHGMGFAGFFQSAALPGEGGLLWQLLAFNLGVEAGQILFLLPLILLQTVWQWPGWSLTILSRLLLLIAAAGAIYLILS